MVCRQQSTIVSNLSKLVPTNVLAKALKRKSDEGEGETGDSPGPSTSKHSYSLADMDRMGDRLSLSDNQLLGLRAELNDINGKRVVAPGLDKHLVQKKQLLSDFYQCQKVTFEGNNSAVTVFCSNILGLAQFVCDERGLDYQKVTKKIGIDGGKVVAQ